MTTTPQNTQQPNSMIPAGHYVTPRRVIDQLTGEAEARGSAHGLADFLLSNPPFSGVNAHRST